MLFSIVCIIAVTVVFIGGTIFFRILWSKPTKCGQIMDLRRERLEKSQELTDKFRDALNRGDLEAAEFFISQKTMLWRKTENEIVLIKESEV